MRQGIIPNLSLEDRSVIETLLRSGKLLHRFAIRLQVVINRFDGLSVQETAKILRTSESSVMRYVIQYNKEGLSSLLRNQTKKPGKAKTTIEKKNEIVSVACKTKPEGKTHWSTRDLAKKLGIGKTTVNSVLREYGVKPHLSKSFSFSTDIVIS